MRASHMAFGNCFGSNHIIVGYAGASGNSIRIVRSNG